MVLKKICDRCGRPSAYRASSKPAFCKSCLKDYIEEQGLIQVTEFMDRKHYFSCRCVLCGIELDYFLDDLLDTHKRPVCQACRLKEATTRDLQWIAGLAGTSIDQLKPVFSDADFDQAAKAGNYTLVSILDNYGSPSSLTVVKCNNCGKKIARQFSQLYSPCPCNNDAFMKVGHVKQVAKEYISDESCSLHIWWDKDLNDSDWNTITPKSRKKCHWKCPKCGNRFVLEPYRMKVDPENRWRIGPCEACNARWGKEAKELDDKLIVDVPKLLLAWDEPFPPSNIKVGCHEMFRFECPNGHHPRRYPSSFYWDGCPTCQRNKRLEHHSLRDEQPEIASQWDQDHNQPLTPDDVDEYSVRVVWWRCASCNYRWQDSPSGRLHMPRLLCPSCDSKIGSLAYWAPNLAKEWSSSNPQSAWQVLPTQRTQYNPEWICSTDPSHVWHASLASRWNGSGCPECKIHGKSQIELKYYSELRKMFDQARSGISLSCQEFKYSKEWTPDIICRFKSYKIAIEYDGFYWHQSHSDRDTKKSRDLLAAGWLVVRLREDALPSLHIRSKHYIEIRVYSTAPRVLDVSRQIYRWAASLRS